MKLFQGITRIGLISLSINLVMVTAKSVLAALTGSLALQAEAIHSVIDVVASVAVVVGLIISGRRARAFPYGLYKVENMISLGIALLLFLVAYEIAHEAITGGERTLELNPLYLGITGGLALVPLVWSMIETRLARRTGSPSLLADARHFQVDVMSAGVVFLALLCHSLGWQLFDRIGAGLVVLFILKAGWDLLKDSGRVLLDASLDSTLLNQITRIVSGFAEVTEVKSVTGRNSGRFRFVEIEVGLRTRELARAHAVSDLMEKTIKEQVPRIDRVVVHFEPEHKAELRLALPVSADGQQLHSKFGEAPRWLFIDCSSASGQPLRRQFADNPFLNTGKGRGIRVAEWLVTRKVDIILTGEKLEGKAPGYTLGNAGLTVIEVIPAPIESITAGLAEYVRASAAYQTAAPAPNNGGTN